MSKSSFAACAIAALAVATPALAYDPRPWIDDLRQMRDAMTTRYANLEWLAGEREIKLAGAFGAVETRLAKLDNDADARALFDRMVSQLGDGHVTLDWSKAAAPAIMPSADQRPCDGMFTTARRQPLAARLAGWTPLDGPAAETFTAGLIDAGDRKVGVLHINLFAAEPALCEEAAREMKIDPAKPCGDACGPLDTAIYQKLTDRFGQRIEALKAAGAQVLLIDLTGNGGGREWAEVAARMVTKTRLNGAPVRLVRTEASAKQLEDQAADIEANVKGEKGARKAELLAAAASLRARAAEARTPCDAAPLLNGETPSCALLVEAGWSTGAWPSADLAVIAGQPWGQSVFQPAKWRWSEGVWSGPLIVLVDGKSASASEEFAAMLQDAKAAVILGAPTHGSGCGHATPAGPVVLKNSGARLSLPDCARLRADGSNEINGVDPDVLIGFRWNDSPARKAKRLEAKLAEAVRLATAAKP